MNLIASAPTRIIRNLFGLKKVSAKLRSTADQFTSAEAAEEASAKESEKPNRGSFESVHSKLRK